MRRLGLSGLTLCANLFAVFYRSGTVMSAVRDSIGADDLNRDWFRESRRGSTQLGWLRRSPAKTTNLQLSAVAAARRFQPVAKNRRAVLRRGPCRLLDRLLLGRRAPTARGVVGPVVFF